MPSPPLGDPCVVTEQQSRITFKPVRLLRWYPVFAEPYPRQAAEAVVELIWDTTKPSERRYALSRPSRSLSNLSRRRIDLPDCSATEIRSRLTSSRDRAPF